MFHLRKTGIKLVEDDNGINEYTGDNKYTIPIPETDLSTTDKNISVKEIRENLLKTLENDTSVKKVVKPPLMRKPDLCILESDNLISKLLPLSAEITKSGDQTCNIIDDIPLHPREEIYDEVENIAETHRNDDLQKEEIGEELYDIPEAGNLGEDENEFKKCQNASNISKTDQPSNTVVPAGIRQPLTSNPFINDIYDVANDEELASSLQTQETSPHFALADIVNQCDEFYEDAVQTGNQYLLPSTDPYNPSRDDEYYEDIVADNLLISSFMHPHKPSRSFDKLDTENFEVPYGLDAWLYQVATANQSRFIVAVNLSSCLLSSYENLSDFNSTVSNSSENTSLHSLSDSRNYVKKDPCKQRKLENEKKKKIERMKKDLKSFKLDPNEEPLIFGNVVANCDFKGSRKDLAYKSGDEISILRTKHTCPEGRTLALNASTMRVGYISKEEFQLLDEYFEESQPSMIPTEDEEIEFYSGSPPAPIIPKHLLPPPVPQTPRPRMCPNVLPQQEDIYDLVT